MRYNSYGIKITLLTNKFLEVLFNFRWPHEGFSVGWDILPPDEVENYYTVKIYLGILTVILHFGEDGHTYI